MARRSHGFEQERGLHFSRPFSMIPEISTSARRSLEPAKSTTILIEAHRPIDTNAKRQRGILTASPACGRGRAVSIFPHFFQWFPEFRPPHAIPIGPAKSTTIRIEAHRPIDASPEAPARGPRRQPRVRPWTSSQNISPYFPMIPEISSATAVPVERVKTTTIPIEAHRQIDTNPKRQRGSAFASPRWPGGQPVSRLEIRPARVRQWTAWQTIRAFRPVAKNLRIAKEQKRGGDFPKKRNSTRLVAAILDCPSSHLNAISIIPRRRHPVVTDFLFSCHFPENGVRHGPCQCAPGRRQIYICPTSPYARLVLGGASPADGVQCRRVKS